MKKALLGLLLVLLFNSTIFAQSIPVTFESDITVGDNWKADSGLSSVAVVDDPAGAGHGKVGEITSSSSGLKWQNAQLQLITNYIDLTSTKTITFDIYTASAQDFLLKLEQSLNGGGNVEVPFSTNGGGWESVTVDFTSVGVNDQYKLLVFFPCYSTGFANDPFDGVSYIDNVSGVIGDPTVPPADINFPIDFESVPTTSDFNNFDGGIATVIDNPQGSGKVGQMVRNGGAVWAGSWLGLSGNIDFTTNKIISMKVFTQAPIGTKIAMKVEGGTLKEVPAFTTKTGEWETISWDFSGTPNDNFKLTFLFDLGNVGDGSATSTFLFDDITLTENVPTAISHVNVNTLKVYPNPVIDVLNIQGSEAGQPVEIYNAAGSLSKKVQISGGTVNIADLPKGIYFISVNGSTSKIIKK
ncbi:T9SS type A sorting domain-containing protein [Carboxylicivirga caseinilyticus]|uniref:T9SS type A sorting domain-containing protein n=1 Tax=Carboxylicivirga caseinilyticus TaxID=3417572 RepID=UPI003D33D96C|nr:T9SS type A sorting domain-containing protein [Marinilabiliaceae bacterium A049]